MKDALINRPEHAAENTGIPELARLADLPLREPSPTLTALGKLHKEKSEAQHKQIRQVELFWNAFTKWLAPHDVTTVKKLTPAIVADYADHEKKIARQKRERNVEGGSLIYLKHRFTMIRRVFNFALKRGVHPADIRHGLDCCAVLTVSNSKTILDPHPIEREDSIGSSTMPRMIRCSSCPSLNHCLEVCLKTSTLRGGRVRDKD